LTVAEGAEAIPQVLDVGLLRFVNELVSLWNLLVPHLGDEPRLRNVEVPATGVDLFSGLRHRQRHPLGHDIEVRGDFEELIQHKGPRLADCFLHGEDTDEMVSHSQVVALGLDVRVDNLIVKELIGVRLTRDPPVLEVDQSSKERKGSSSV
jgi:hypothetical protein